MPVAVPSTLPNVLQDSRMLTIPQVAEWLGVSKYTIFNLMSRKKDPLPSVLFGKSRRFPLDKVRYWIENQSAPTDE